ncbi:MAG: N-acetyl-gamma-glutamyl-phosphate reductase [Planctomycetia bacterium]|nr:N-acetyl-gamma-glutamyl-phosphate reductase [Planctomycetia bacterium]
MIRVAILGATGYTAVELITLLLRHSEVEITALTTRSDDRPHVSQVHPALTGRLNMYLENLSAKEVAQRAECVFCCLPHKASAERIPEFLDAGCRVIDLSADYRLDSAHVFRQWYEVDHPDAERLGHVPYGLPELFRSDIRGAQLIANPGCYPTSAILALGPLLKEKLIKNDGIIIDSKSGASGAGRSAKQNLLYCEVNEGFSAYGVGVHRHTPEIEQVLTKMAAAPVDVIFTPHLVPMERGILTTTYSFPVVNVTQAQILDFLRDFYRTEPFIRVTETLPNTRDCRFTNFVNITARVVKNRVITVSALDNLIKGAAGAAVQNFNLAYGFPETNALL